MATATPSLKSRFSRENSSDLLSPILVKELRQGMRSRSFVSIYLLTQLAMFLVLVTTLLSTATTGSNEEVFVIFWVCVTIVFIGIFPMMGVNAVAQEMKAETLDLVSLTRLTSIRIVIGKWAALLCQSLLIVTSIVPYLVVRYFVGGINFLEELGMLMLVYLLSAIFLSLAVSISSIKIVGLRALIAAGAFVGLFFFAVGGVNAFIFGGVFSGSQFWDMVLILVFLGPFVAFLALEMGAARISPMAENHDARKRLLTIGVFIVGYILYMFVGVQPEAVFFILVSVGAVAAVNAMFSEPTFIPTVFKPFVKRGTPGKVLGSVLLYPGWHSGLIFSVGISVALFFMFIDIDGMLRASGPSMYREVVFTFITLNGTLYVTMAAHRLPRLRHINPLIFFLGFNIVMIILGVFAIIIHSVANVPAAYMLCWLPAADLVMGGIIFEWQTPYDLEVINFCAGVTTFLAIIALFVHFMKERGKYREAENVASKLVD